jgi:hypothetical protein
MPKIQSRLRDRNVRLHAQWDAHPDSAFAAFGQTRAALKAAQTQLIGHIVTPMDQGWNDGRLLSNPVFSPQPSMIVYCAAETDVAIALGLAAGGQAPFTVRSGGHCTAGFSGGNGVLIDVSGLNDVSVDQTAMTAVVGTGCAFGKLNKILTKLKLHTPAGECDDVCVGGFVQGGGLGFSSATFGMNCDNVIEFRVMLFDGSIVMASADKNYDLFWALRGGTGGNFGVLLSVKYKLYPLQRVMGFSVAWDVSTSTGLQQAVDVMMMMQNDYFGAAETEFNLTLQVLVVWQTQLVPNGPYLPKLTPIFMVRGMYVGDIDFAGYEAMGNFVRMPGAVVQFAQEGDYLTVLNSLLSTPQEQPIIDGSLGAPNEDKASRYVAKNLTAAEWSSLLGYFVSKANNTMAYMYLEVYGGQIAAVPVADSAFVHRTALYNAVLDVFWFSPSERHAAETFLEGWTAGWETVWNNESYQNYASVRLPDYATNYWGTALPGLSLVKAKYDPANVFTFAQQVPTGVGAGATLPPMLQAWLSLPIDYSSGYQSGT